VNSREVSRSGLQADREQKETRRRERDQGVLAGEESGRS